jgi:pimeloyl-ACP methyl ester carboxylesterase
MPKEMQAFSRACGWKMYQEVRACFFGVESFEVYQIASLPCTLVMGERTTAASRAMTRALARLYPNAYLIELAKTGHMAPITHAPLVYEAMSQHVQQIR